MKGLLGIIFLCISVVSLFIDKHALMDKLTVQEINFLYRDPLITHKVHIEITKLVKRKNKDGVKPVVIGELHAGLFGYTVPFTVNNFIQLANRTNGYGYHDRTLFHHVIKDFMIQTGDYQFGEGYGGHSVYNNKGKFRDENFKLKHNKQGRMSMANGGPNTNGGQFFITASDECPWLDGKHVVFGQIINGFDTLDYVNTARTDKNDRPKEEYVMSKITIDTLDENYLSTIDLSRVNDIGYNTMVGETSLSYTYISLFLLCAALGMLYRRWHYRRQAFSDMKDPDFY